MTRFRQPGTALVAALLLLAACGPPAHRQAWQGRADAEQTIDLVRLHQTRDAVDYAWQRTRAGQLGESLADDVVFAPPAGAVLLGRDEAKKWFHRTTRGMYLRDTYVSESLDLAGDFAVEVWSIDREIKRDDIVRRFRLKGMHVYERQESGEWLLARRIWNMSPGHGSVEERPSARSKNGID